MTDTRPYSKGDLITLAYYDGTRTRSWHGRFDGLITVISKDYGQVGGLSRTRWAHAPTTGATATQQEWVSEQAQREGVVVGEWIRLGRAADRDFDPQGLPRDARDWQFGGIFSMMIRADLPGLTVTPVTVEGQQYIRTHESAEAKRERLIARFRDLDPEAAEELDSAIEDLVQAAEERGEQREAARAYDY